jgi:uncharacterized protein YdaU (DUF1376 family)
MTKRADAWMPVYIGDYTGDTLRFSTEAHGAYFLLIMDYWRQGPPPDDDEVLASITKLPVARWRKHRRLIEPLFKIKGGHWHHKRIDAEREAAAEITSKRSEAGKRGAEAKWQRSGNDDDRPDGGNDGKPPDQPMANTMANAKANASQNDAPSPSPSQSPSGSPELPIGRSYEPGAAGAPSGEADLLEIPLGLLKTPDGDWSKPLFRQGLSWLAGVYGKPPNALRSFLGRCLQQAQGDHKRVFDLLAQAQREAIADPQAWITAALQPGSQQSEVESAIASIRRKLGA